MLRKAVFIDRDNTIAIDGPYCSRPEDLRLFNGVAKSIKKLNDAGFLVIIITNQSGISRGFFTADMLEKIHNKLKKDLAKDGARVDAIYYCPHLPDEGCSCRKPEIGLIKKALEDFDISLKDSYVVGDREHDVEMAKKAGCAPILVDNYNPDSISFNEAVDLILKKL